jgi:hypothetical protein
MEKEGKITMKLNDFDLAGLLHNVHSTPQMNTSSTLLGPLNFSRQILKEAISWRAHVQATTL